MLTLKNILKFVELTHRFQQTKRAILVKNEQRQENDLEHSCQLALLGWYIIECQKLPLDKDLAIRYALIHDLVETYAGDTHFYYGDQQTKPKLEKKAALKLKKQFPRFATVHKLIGQYEEKQDAESKFIHTLDKLLPILNIYLDNGRTWKTDGVTKQMLITRKAPYLSTSSELKQYFDKLVTIFNKRKDLFPKLNDSKP